MSFNTRNHGNSEHCPWHFVKGMWFNLDTLPSRVEWVVSASTELKESVRE